MLAVLALLLAAIRAHNTCYAAIRTGFNLRCKTERPEFCTCLQRKRYKGYVHAGLGACGATGLAKAAVGTRRPPANAALKVRL